MLLSIAKIWKLLFLGHFVKSIGKGAFASCGKLKNINLENIIVETEIKDDAFLYCRELENVILPKHLKELNKRVFAYCSKLNNVKFNDELKKIGMLAFVYCKSLKSVEFPESLEEMTDDSFKNTLIVLYFLRFLIMFLKNYFKISFERTTK